jgi:hypothetical protein
VTFVSGNTYDGLWAENKKRGRGVFTFVSGASWDGTWGDSGPSGMGAWRFPGGLQLHGAGPTNVEQQQSTAPAKWRAAAEAAGGGASMIGGAIGASGASGAPPRATP